MNPIAVHPIILYGLLGFSVILMGVIVYIVFQYAKFKKLDSMVFIYPSGRWTMIKDTLKDVDTYSHEGKKYILSDKSGLLNSKGKVLYIFSINKPQPMAIAYNEAKWLSSDSMMSIINNKLIQKLVQTTDPLIDKMILMGAVGGMIAGMASVIILIKQFGVI